MMKNRVSEISMSPSILIYYGPQQKKREKKKGAEKSFGKIMAESLQI